MRGDLVRVGSVALGVLIGVLGSSPTESAEDIRLSTVPSTVFKVQDGGRLGTESWYFNLVVTDERNREGIRPLRAVLETHAGQTLLERRELSESALAPMVRASYRVTPDTDALSLRRRFSLDEAFDLRFGFPVTSREWSADRVRVTLTLEIPGSAPETRRLDVPLRTHTQRTKLVFPLRGPAMVSQGPINNLGHSGHANQFAIDVIGLDSTYAPMIDGRQGNASFAGWGRPISAPVDGTVVYARNDVPDNPPDANPVDVYSQVPEPLLAIAGNCLIIDHGNGEYSALMHMQQGSVTVPVGATVQQGQVVGRMGSSGDAFGVHLHYQLQNGPGLFRASSLPVSFEDLEGVDLVRGVYVETQ